MQATEPEASGLYLEGAEGISASAGLKARGKYKLRSVIIVLDSKAIPVVEMGVCLGTIVRPTRVLLQDPCPLGLPEILTAAHMRPLVASANPY